MIDALKRWREHKSAYQALCMVEIVNWLEPSYQTYQLEFSLFRRFFSQPALRNYLDYQKITSFMKVQTTLTSYLFASAVITLKITIGNSVRS